MVSGVAESSSSSSPPENASELLEEAAPPSPLNDPIISPPAPLPSNPNLIFPHPAFRLTTEFDSESAVLFNKLSCKLFDRLAKLKLSFTTDKNGQISSPNLGFITKYLSVLYDLEDHNALVKGLFNVGPGLQFRAAQDVKAQQGEVTMEASLANPAYNLELVSAVPSVGLPRATFKFPLGEVSLEEKQDEEVKRVLSISGILKGQVMNGVCTAEYKDNDLNLRYSYKDEEMSFIPSVSLPSNIFSFAFKRRFSPSDKLSYWYNFNSRYWNAVYKHSVSKDLKLKAGYDSEVRLGWASLWVGDENGKTKTAPMKVKVQVMLQVPQDDIASSLLMFRVKKRWDF